MASAPGAPAHGRRRASGLLASVALLALLVTCPLGGVARAAQGGGAAALSLTVKLASGVRSQDFRKAVPDALNDRHLPSLLTELANPYMPDDRRIFKIWALTPHPDGSLIFWADVTHFAGADDGREFMGLWRMEPDGRVTPFAVESEAEFQHARLNCDGAFREVTVGRPAALAVEPDGSVVAAQSAHGVVIRVHPDGFVQRIAGGGDDWCTRNNPSDIGYADGPGPQALFSNSLDIALAPQGGIYVAEQDANRTHFLERIRYIDGEGNVTTRFVGESCWTNECSPHAVGVAALRVDHSGQLIVVDGRVVHNREGQEQLASAAHRIDPASGVPTLIAVARLLIPEPGEPFGLFYRAAILPDGRPVAKASGGIVLLDGVKPQFSYWVKWKEGPGNDGPVATTSFAGDQFCVMADGTVFMVNANGLRRLDPKTQRVTTWLR